MRLVRKAVPADLPAMVALSAAKRAQYEAYQPVFWRRAPNADEQQTGFFAHQLGRENVIALVSEEDGQVVGFVIAALVSSPPVYAPGGLTCLVDDFCVAGPDRWSDIGEELLTEVRQSARERGAAQLLVVCGHLDDPKRTLLGDGGLRIASEWWVRPI